MKSIHYKTGYTQGTFDMFHIGHLNLLRNARQYCDRLIVGVNADELVKAYKQKTPVIPENERAAIIEAIKYVDEVMIVHTLKKADIHSQLHFDAIFIGNDWEGNPRWRQTEADLRELGADVVYLKHTEGVSSTLLRAKEAHRIEG